MNELAGAQVLVTRPDPAGSFLCAEIEKLGGSAVFFPTIAFAEPKDQAALKKSLETIDQQAWLIFISPQAVIRSVPLLRARWPHLPDTVKLAAIGEGTKQALQAAGYTVSLVPVEWSTEGLMAMPEMQAIAAQNVTIVRGEDGRHLLAEMLMKRNACVSHLIVYERVLPVCECEWVRELIRKSAINMIVCGSYMAVLHLKILLGENVWPLLRKIKILVMSERIKELALELGFQTICVSRDTIQGLIKLNK